MPDRKIYDLDSVDRRILEHLVEDGRRSFTQIGNDIGLSSTSVAERVRRLEGEGIIRGYHADVDAAKIGFPITAFLLARSMNSDATFSQVVETRPEVTECYRVTGEVSFVLRAVFNGVEHLEELIDYLERKSYVTTLVVLSAPFQRKGLPVRETPSGAGKRRRRSG